MPNKYNYEVLGIGNPIMDQILLVSEEYMASIFGVKGGMETVDYETLIKIIDNAEVTPTLIAGGSGTNTIKGLAQFGEKCAVAGMIGDDPYAKKFLNRLSAMGITPLYSRCSIPTAQVACLVTPDGERSCRTFLGASKEMRGDLLLAEHFEGVKLVHIEGYSLLNESLTEKSMELAKSVNAKISFDLASLEIAQQYKQRIIHLVSQYVDILFANEDETFALTQLNPELGCDILKDICEVAVVKMGKNGCWVGCGAQKEHYPAFPVTPVDTTGAGDLFASGFLYGCLQDKSFAECARYGALAGAAVVQVIGAEIPQAGWDQIKAQL